VDGKGVGDIGDVVLRDRRRLSGDGVVVVLLGVDEQTGDIIYGPEIVSRGFVFEDHSGFILDEAKSLVLQVVNEIENRSHMDWAEVAPDIKKSLKRYFFNTIERRPLILPIIMPV
jgi:ribonuclease J